ncbi:hypothetical protein AKJ16_DCAP08665 [Drosera capensis]
MSSATRRLRLGIWIGSRSVSEIYICWWWSDHGYALIPNVGLDLDLVDLYHWRHEINAILYDAWRVRMIDHVMYNVYRRRRVILRGGKVALIDDDTEGQLKEL